MTTESQDSQIQPQTEVKTEIPVETIETIKAELVKTQKERDEYFKGLKTAHQTSTEKDNRLKTMADLKAEINKLTDRVESQDESQRLYLAFIAEHLGKSENVLQEEIENRKPDLLKMIKDEEAKIKQKREDERKKAETETQIAAKRAEDQARVDSYRERVEKLGIDPKSKLYRRIRDFATAGLYDSADAELEELEEAKKSEPSKETIEQQVERRAQEILKAKGLLKTETTVPAGSGTGIPTTMAEFKKWAAEIPLAEYEKVASKVNEMLQQGQIK